jgi:DNA-binding NtrC family response regulator
MTAHGSLSSAREAMILGVVDYLSKPFDLKEVIAVVQEALE